jgi:hypothetical protein
MSQGDEHEVNEMIDERRRSRAVAAVAAAALTSVFADATWAAPMRCGTEIIDVGASMAEVLKHCGEPAKREVEVQDVRSGNRVVGQTTFETWYYTESGLTHVLEFDQDELIRIK